MLLAPAELVSEFQEFRMVPPAEGHSHQVALHWETRYRISIRAEARLAPGSDELKLRCSPENRGDRTILALRYPAIQGIGTLAPDSSQDRLLRSTMMGALFFDPFHLIRGASPVRAERGLTISRYPNGFHGSALQLMAYFVEDRGGFYVAIKDSDGGDKDLNFYKAPDDKSLVCEIAHIQRDARAGKSLTVDYPVVIAALNQGSWHAAADRYRDWALQQPWCQKGTHRDRVAVGLSSRWLLERTGAVGAWWPFRTDIRAEIIRTRRLYDAPLLHLELWWSHGPAHQSAQSDGDHFGPIVTFPVPSHPSPSDARTRFLRGLVAARTDFARDFLADGRLRRPPPISCGTVDLDHGLAENGWLRRIRFPRKQTDPRPAPPPATAREQDTAESRELSVEQWATGLLSIPFATARKSALKSPSVLCQAYTLGETRLGMLLVNLRLDSDENVRLPVDAASYGLPPGNYEIRQDRNGVHHRLGILSSGHVVELKLAPRVIVLVSATRVPG
jgi:hypothetical protein